MVEIKTGFTKKEVLNKNLFKDDFPKQLAPLIEHIKSAIKNKKTEIKELEINDKHKNPLRILANASIIRLEDDNLDSLVLLGKDISSQRIFHKKLKIGNAYITYDKPFDRIIDSIENFSQEGYSFLCISREELDWLKHKLPKSITILLSDKKKKGIIAEIELQKILKKIKAQLRKTIVVLDRLEYISSTCGFKKLLEFLYQLRDCVRFTDCIVIIRVVENCFKQDELAFLKEEFNELPLAVDVPIYIDKKRLSVLNFISQRNSFDYDVPFNLISSQFNLSRATTKKWLSELQKKLLIKVARNGRFKYIFITEKGKELICK